MIFIRPFICLLLLLCTLLFSVEVMADSRAYMEVVTIKAFSKNYIVTHHHDWDNDHIDSVQAMFFDDVEPFARRNKYSYIECRDRKTGRLLFKKSCPPFQRVEISPDEQHIVGISPIMLYNFYQLVVFSSSGKLIKKRHIADGEAMLSPAQFDSFKMTYPKQFDYLNRTGKVFYFKRNYFIDFLIQGLPERLGEAGDYLGELITDNHLSQNFSESTTNWVWWYHETNPSIRFHYKDGRLVSLTLLDSQGKRFVVPIVEPWQESTTSQSPTSSPSR